MFFGGAPLSLQGGDSNALCQGVVLQIGAVWRLFYLNLKTAIQATEITEYTERAGG